MFGYVDATPFAFNPDRDVWHKLYKRDAPEEGGEGEGEGGNKVLKTIKESPKLLKEEIEKDADFLSKKTHIPTW